MILQYDSIGVAMQKVLRDINVQDVSIKDDLINWVADALDLMNTTHQLFPQNKLFDVKNYGVTLPCGVKSVQAVTHNGCRILYGESRGGIIYFEDAYPKPTYIRYWTVKPLEIVPNEYHQIGMNYIQASIQQLEQVGGYNVYDELYYYVEGNGIGTNLREGEVEIFYLGIKLDDKGYPLVPKNKNVQEAIVNYVDYKLTRRGDKEGRWDVAFQMWETMANRAMSEIEFPSPERTQSLMDSTLGLIKPSYYDEFDV